MMLKKQTVWLLTMLSLVVVLSVYYVTTPDGMKDNVAFVNQDGNKTANLEDGKTANNDEGAKVKTEEADDETLTSSISSDDVFTALRMEIEDQRNRLREELNAIVASTSATAEQKSEALDKIQKLSTLAEKEAMLETLIKSKGYEDVLVRADEEQVRVIIKAKDRSTKAANEIMQLVYSEIREVRDVAVEFQPEK